LHEVSTVLVYCTKSVLC